MILYLKIFALHMGIWALLPVFKFSRMRSWLRAKALTKLRRHMDDPRRLADMVSRTTRFLPGANCLTEALCCQTVLLRSGYASKMILGITRDDRRKLDAHAWVELDGEVVIGDNGELERYKTLRRRGE